VGGPVISVDTVGVDPEVGASVIIVAILIGLGVGSLVGVLVGSGVGGGAMGSGQVGNSVT